MKLHKLIATKSDCYKANKKIKVKGLMLHSTGANNPKLSRYVGPDDGIVGPNKYNITGTLQVLINACMVLSD